VNALLEGRRGRETVAPNRRLQGHSLPRRKAFKLCAVDFAAIRFSLPARDRMLLADAKLFHLV
jgi:hypothetical protein